MFKNILLMLCFLLVQDGIKAQVVPTSEKDKDRENVVKVSTTLINLPLIISDRSGRRISDIRKDEISVFAGDNKLDIDFFADSNEPITYAILIDTSGSTKSLIGRIKNAAKQFVSTMDKQDKGSILSFDESVHNITKGFFSDQQKLRKDINFAQICENPGSVMNDAFERLVLKEFAGIKGRKAIIVLTDGDVNGKSTSEYITKICAQSDIIVYPIFFQTRPLFPATVKSVSFDEFVKIEPVNYLYTLAKVTGGKLLVAESDSFEASFQLIADELRKQYVVGFYVDADSDAGTRNISIKVNRSDAVVRTKSSIKVISEESR